MSDRRQSFSSGSDHQGVNCVICLGTPKFPTGRPDACKHIFCFLCLNNWVKRRSECPLCKCRTTFIVKTSADGKETKVKVRQRTEAQFSHELANADAQDVNHEEVDITVAFAECRVCHRSDNADRLLLCDGTVGQEFDGSPIRCNAAYHCYCLPEPLVEVPRGRWYCPFCIDMQETQRGVYNRRYANPRISSRTRSRIQAIDLTDEDQPGPSRGRRINSRRRIVVDDDESFSEEMSTCEEASGSERDGSDLMLNDEEESEASFTSESEAEESGEEEDWDEIDRYVLDGPDSTYIPDGPRTTVRRRAKRKKSVKRKSKKKSTKKSNKKVNERKSGEVVRKKKRRTTKRKSVTRGQRRLASAIGIDPETGEVERRTKKDRYPADGIRRGKFGTPVLSLLGGDYDELPIPEENDVPESKAISTSKQQIKSDDDLIGSIMFEQTKTLAPARYQKVGRDGTILETEMMTEHRKKINEKISGNHAFAPPKVMNTANTASKSDDHTNRLNIRKNRPSRWGSPTHSIDQNCATNTASIPLPTGPPIPQKTPLDFIPVPQSNVVRPPITSPMNLNSRPSALNTSPSTSFALNAFAPPLPPFGMNTNALGTQTSVPQLGTLSVPQLPLPSQLFPGLLMPPSLTFGAVNDLLAAGLIGNAALTAPPVSQAPPFVLGQVTNQSQDLTQQLANIASSLHPLGTHPSRLTVTGVPPPPPSISNGKPEVDLSISKPLAEKIRQIAEGGELRPLVENHNNNEKKEEQKGSEEPKHNESGRKSASAEEEEEASDADVKVTTSKGPMFNQARQMLSTSLKKIFKKRLITKDEYKMIMKKGVTALSQRTRLNQAKVDDYANKYVQCIIHRRKKKR